jgi:hypothetical protein
MAEISVTAVVPVSLDHAWSVVSDLGRFEEWLSLHDGWRSEVPSEISEGLQVQSVVRAKGIRNRIAWTVQDYAPPRHVALIGEGVGGTAVDLTFDLAEVEGGVAVEMLASFKHPLLKGPMGSIAARTIKGDLESSMKKLIAIST